MNRRFSLKRLLASAALLSIGLAAWGWSYRNVLHPDATTTAFPIAVLYLGGGAFAWAGIFCPIKKTATGALLGLMISGLIVAILFAQK